MAFNFSAWKLRPKYRPNSPMLNAQVLYKHSPRRVVDSLSFNPVKTWIFQKNCFKTTERLFNCSISKKFAKKYDFKSWLYWLPFCRSLRSIFTRLRFVGFLHVEVRVRQSKESQLLPGFKCPHQSLIFLLRLPLLLLWCKFFNTYINFTGKIYFYAVSYAPLATVARPFNPRH